MTQNGDNRWDTENPARIDRELRPLLKEIRLVGELDLSLDGEIYRKATSAAKRLIAAKSWNTLGRTCPAPVVVFLVAEGVHRYRGGTFWPRVSVADLIGPAEQQKIGQAFEEALRTLGLATFRYVVAEEGALRFVTPILLHGGIPAYCATDVWGLLLGDMRSGTSDAGHLLSVWRTSGFRGLDKPVVRFLRHGGAFAGDLIARMWQLADDVADMGMSDARVRGTETLAHDAGLPRYLVEKLLQGEHEPVRRGPQLPRPVVRIDPYDGRGPYLELPPAPRHDGSWILSGRGDALRRVRISQRDSRELPLGPDSPWNVELRTSIAERLWTFAGMHAAPVYFFAEDGKIAGNQESLRGPWHEPGFGHPRDCTLCDD